MKDYSNLIPTSYGFVTKYEIVGDEIHIYTSETKKGEPHKYPLNEEWLSKIERRLENQYRLITENRAIVKKTKVKELISKISPITTTSISALIVGAVFCIINSLTIVCGLLVSIALLLALGKNAIIKQYAKKLDSEFDLIEAYLQNKNGIEDLSQTDKNITAYLSKSATKRLNENQSLKENGTISNAFNVDFMDKTSNHELRKMLDRYTISKSLLEEQSFVAPSEEQVSKKSKTKKKRK